MLKNDVKTIIAILLLTIITHGVAPEWCEWLINSFVGTGLKWAYGFLSSYCVIKFVFAFLLLVCGLVWSCRIFIDEDFRWYRPALLLWGFVLLFDNNTLLFVQIWNGFDFRGGTLVIAGFVILAMIGKTVNRFWPYQDTVSKWWIEKRKTNVDVGKTNDDTGFPTDDIKPQNTPKALQQYADAITEQLLGTKLNEHSFAMGITGEWGSGKTTFLDLLETKLDDKAEIVTFNPWMCRTPEQVTDDFFATLQHQLSLRHSSLSKPIRDYAKYISNATLSLKHGFLSELSLAIPQESLQEKKKRLSERFARLKKPVVVKIDDLDRLESSEVFEVLRLIRNTADLKNTIYVVAYDKEYVTNVLKDKAIKDSSAYLEKIFPVEVHQPKVEDYQIIQVLYNDLKRIELLGGSFADELLRRVTPTEKELLVKILGNYRQARRFVRIYSLNVLYIQKVFTNEIKLKDLFWMELLQTYDKLVYDVLAKDPGSLLYYKAGRYIVRPGVGNKYIPESEKMHAYKGEVIWKEGTIEILNLLFREDINETPSSICMTENYDKYFTLGVSPYKLSKRDFKNLFVKKGEEEITVKGWIKDGKHFGSVKYMFDNCKVGELGDEDLKSYLVGALSYGLVLGNYYHYDVGYAVHSMLKQERFKPKQYQFGKDVIIQWLDEKVGILESPIALTMLLNRLFVKTEYDEDYKALDIQPLLITNADVVRLLQNAMGGYLKRHPEITVMSLFDEKTEMGKVFMNCCVQTDIAMMDDEYDAWENVAIDMVISHFKGQSKPSLKEEQLAYDNMFMDDMPEWDDDPESQAYFENAYRHRSLKLNSYFGSNTESFKKLLESCFADDTNDNVIDTNIKTKTNTKPNTKTKNKTKNNNLGKNKSKEE